MKKKNMKKEEAIEVLRTVVLIGYIMIIMLFVIWFPSIVLMSFLQYYKESENFEVERSLNEYQYLKYDTSSNQTSFGIVSKEVVLEGDSFMSYQDEDDNHILISNFGTEEYKCTGSCFCEEDTTFRRGSSGLALLSRKKVLIYLVAAASSTIAIQFARSQFQTECEHSGLDMNCPIDSIRSNVENCMSVLKDERELTSMTGYDKRLDFVDPTSLRMLCKGNCVLRTAGSSNKEFFERYTETQNPCTDLTKSALVDIYITSTSGPEEVGYRDYEKAREKFRQLYLREFCRRQRISINRLLQDEDEFARLKYNLEEEDRYGAGISSGGGGSKKKKEGSFWGELFGYDDDEENNDNDYYDDRYQHQQQKRNRYDEDYDDVQGDIQCGEGSSNLNQNVHCRRIRHSDKL